MKALPPMLARSNCSRAVAELWNMYGPTETTIWSTVHRVTAADEAQSLEAEAMPIGEPIANTDVYILDSHSNLAPTGSEGEICIGGDGLARGYFKRDELTAEKFVPNPLKQGARLYRTGDVGRWLPNSKTNAGTLLYSGRRDQQVKIRGFRIELSEVENALSRHSAVASAVVTARNGIAPAVNSSSPTGCQGWRPPNRALRICARSSSGHCRRKWFRRFAWNYNACR